jgi:3-deoxy-7-phosphoheptulonate synthase
VQIGANGVLAAQHQHVAVFNGYQVETLGNKFAHLVLRGGEITGPNYDVKNLRLAKDYLEKHQVVNPAVIIDASHDNCLLQGKKDYKRQSTVVHEVMDSLKTEPELKKLVKGFMLESFIKSGNQKIDEKHPEATDRNGLSITDPCLSWEDTEKLLLELRELV